MSNNGDRGTPPLLRVIYLSLSFICLVTTFPFIILGNLFEQIAILLADLGKFFIGCIVDDGDGTDDSEDPRKKEDSS